MFKLGEYEEFEAEEIADYLKDAGVKVDLKPSISASVESAVYMEGRASELRERIDDFEAYDRYIEALRTVLSEKVDYEEFIDRYLSLLNPSWSEGMEDIFGDVSSAEKKSRESAASRIEHASTIFTNLLGAAEALQFLDAALELNEIDIEGGIRGELGDDPLLRIAVDPDDCDPDDELTTSILSVRLEKTVEVRLDELTTPLAKDADDEFAEEYPEEYYKIAALGMAVERIIEPPGDSNKIDIDEFRDLLVFGEEMEDFILMVDGTAVAEDIAKTLKKEGVIKIKGDKIAWKR